MPITTKNGTVQWTPSQGEVRKKFLQRLLLLVIFLLSARVISQETMWPFVLDAPAQVKDFISRMFPPDFRYTNRVLPALVETMNLSIFGTAGAALVSIPLAIIAAKNTSPSRVLRLLALAIIVTTRSVTSLIWALLIVQIVGPGLFAGVLAIGVRGIGMISKLLYEAIEEINPEPIEAIKATGASAAQVFLYGYVPQLLPTFVGVTVLRWEINIRESTIIGIVGGGGIGFLLNSAVNRLRWDQVIVVLLAILVIVFLAELISAKARQAVT